MADPDGCKIAQATAHYRKQFKDDIFAALAKGWEKQKQLAASRNKGTIAAVVNPHDHLTLSPSHPVQSVTSVCCLLCLCIFVVISHLLVLTF